MKYRIEKNCTSQREYEVNEKEELFFDRLYNSLPEGDRLFIHLYRMSNGTLSVYYKTYPIGKIKLQGRVFSMQIQNLNALVDTVRHEIIERYRPGEDDPHLKVLQAAHISDDEYFSHMVLDDLNLIIRDIREAHKKDSESAPQTTVADELKENLEAVEKFKGSRDEKLVILYCKQLGINYKNLSEEEFRWLIRILKKSKKMGTPISQRKKR